MAKHTTELTLHSSPALDVRLMTALQPSAYVPRASALLCLLFYFEHSFSVAQDAARTDSTALSQATRSVRQLDSLPSNAQRSTT